MSAASKMMAKALRKESGSIDPRLLGAGATVGGGAYAGYKLKKGAETAKEEMEERRRAAERKAEGN